MTSLLELTKDLGPIIALLIFFIWRDYKRELSMTNRIQSVEDYQKQRLEVLVVMTNNTIIDHTVASNRLATVLGLRPCLSKDTITLDQLDGTKRT